MLKWGITSRYLCELYFCPHNAKINYSNRDTKDNFWNLETIGVKESELSNYEKYENFITINSEGRYETKLPFKENDNYIIIT